MFTSDTHIDLYRLEGKASEASLTKTQVLAALAVSTGSMIVGYSSAWSSPAIASLEKQGSRIEVSSIAFVANTLRPVIHSNDFGTWNFLLLSAEKSS